MSLPGGRAVLVLGGIRSGRSQYAESLLAGAAKVRRIDPGPGDDLVALARTLVKADPDETLLVDGLDSWLGPGGDPDGSAVPLAAAADEAVSSLAAAVRGSAARLVLVSPEVGLSAPEAAGRASAEAIGALNHAVAGAADEVVLVVAGQPVRLRAAGDIRAPAAVVPSGSAAGAELDESRLAQLPLPDERAQEAARGRLAGAGLGALTAVVSFAAATQGEATPSPWRAVRIIVLRADHAGAASSGAEGSTARAAALHLGTGALGQLAGQAGAQLHVVEAEAAAAIEDGPALGEPGAQQALAAGWRLAEQAADEGIDLLVLGSIGDGADTAAAAVTAALGGQAAEPAGLLARVRAPDGTIDDDAWIRRCAALRDAVYRARSTSRTSARQVVAELGGADIATGAGLILGAAARRTPVALDGPVGAAAALVARHLAAESRRWCLLVDHGGHPTVVRAGAVLNLAPVLDLKLALGEGTATLAALPLLRSALLLAGAQAG